AVVVPHSVVANPSCEPIRRWVQRDFAVEAVCRLPAGVFRPFGGAQGRAAVLWLRRAAPAQVGWHASLGDPGYDVRRRRYVTTHSDELDALVAGRGWQPLAVGAWEPVEPTPRGPTVASRAS